MPNQYIELERLSIQPSSHINKPVLVTKPKAKINYQQFSVFVNEISIISFTTKKTIKQ